MSKTEDDLIPIEQLHIAGKVKKRLALILDVLDRGGCIKVEDLIQSTGASPATIRRDLRLLERQRLVNRDYGAVYLAGSALFEPFLADPPFREHVHRMAAEKRRIGIAAAELVQNGETIGIAAGTTADQIARFLATKKDVSVVTNALNVAMELSKWKRIKVHLTGGYLSGDWFALVGPRALDFVSTMFLDKFFVGANGVHCEHGVTDRHTDEAAVNSALLRKARRKILLADHTKLGETANCLVCPTQGIDMIITDVNASDEMIAPFVGMGIEVRRV